jgi:putative transposase
LKREGLSMRRAQLVMGISASSLRYEPAPDRNGALRERLHAVSRPGLGYRGAWATLREEFSPLNVKRVHRLWRELRLGQPVKRKKKKTGSPMPDSPTRPNELWCLDFCWDACLNGTKLKVLAIVDEYTRECLALEAHTSLKAVSVRRILSGLFESRGAPKYLRSDNGPEFVAHSLTMWLRVSGTESKFIKPGSPWMNGKVESFNSRLRAEFLNAELFHNLAEAQVKLRLFQRFYNEERPHSSLDYLTPARYAERFHECKMEAELYG